ncbi:MAG: hypothetical protein H0X37_25535 [Herpetosiphonaceae bacterium]|nr:hypothetical protein [Herpetosiphonaceae bacterium]
MDPTASATLTAASTTPAVIAPTPTAPVGHMLSTAQTGILGTLALLIILLPILVAVTANWQSGAQRSAQNTSQSSRQSFFEIPYITWFLLHYGFGSLSLLAVVTLAVTGIIQQDVTSTIVVSLLGYVLVSAASRRQSAVDTARQSTLAITTISLLPAGIQQQPYSQKIEVSGGTVPYTWSL